MSSWIQIDASSLQTDELRRVAGVEIAIGLSPYDIPSDVRGFYDKELRRFVIEFRYALGEDEEREELPHSDHVTLFVGKESGCLYEIHLDVDEIGTTSVGLRMRLPEVNSALLRLADTFPNGVRKRHYKVMGEVVEEASQELLASP